MGGSIRRDVSGRTTHLIAKVSGGEKYQYCAIFRMAIMNMRWVLASWEQRHDVNFSATAEGFVVSFATREVERAPRRQSGFALSRGGAMSELCF